MELVFVSGTIYGFDKILSRSISSEKLPSMKAGESQAMRLPLFVPSLASFSMKRLR